MIDTKSVRRFRKIVDAYHTQAKGALVHIQIGFTHYLIGRNCKTRLTVWIKKPSNLYGWLFIRLFGFRFELGKPR